MRAKRKSSKRQSFRIKYLFGLTPVAFIVGMILEDYFQNLDIDPSSLVIPAAVLSISMINKVFAGLIPLSSLVYYHEKPPEPKTDRYERMRRMPAQGTDRRGSAG
jgi:hypothetical protein